MKDSTGWSIVISVIVGVGTALFTSNENWKLEKEQFESGAILKAVDAGNLEQSKKDLEFLATAGIISKDNEKLIRILGDTLLKIKYPTVTEITVEPMNDFVTNLYQLYSGQVVDENDKPLDSVLIKIFRTFGYDTTSFSLTFSDKNGLFKLPLPNGRNKVKFGFIKRGYIFRGPNISFINGLHGKKRFRLERE